MLRLVLNISCFICAPITLVINNREEKRRSLQLNTTTLVLLMILPVSTGFSHLGSCVQVKRFKLFLFFLLKKKNLDFGEK